jgi:hypothetical protein
LEVMRASIALTLLAIASAPAAAQQLHVPDGLVLGRDDVRTIAAPAGVARFATNAGSIDAHAQWHLPAEHRPQRAIVAAFGEDGSVVAWTTASLAAEAHVEVRTEPHASVVVRVGDVELPPVDADERGIAVVTVVVPPGIGEALATATDARGNTTEKTIELGVAASARTLAACDPRGDRVVVIATNDDGSPATEPPVVTASSGTLGAPSTLAPGVFAFAVAGLASGDRTTVGAHFADEPAASCELVVPHVDPPAPHVATVEVVAPPSHERAIVARAEVGYVTSFGRVSAPLAQLAIGVPFARGFEVGASLGGYSTSFEASSAGATVTAHVMAAPLLARAAYHVRFGAFDAWAGAGVGAAIVATRLDSASVGMLETTDVHFAASGFIGAATRVGPGAIVVEAGYLQLELHDHDVYGRAGGLVATAGYAW